MSGGITENNPNAPDVLIIGGGVAGLAAAVELTSQKFSVTLVEQKQRCGGRTYSFPHAETGDEVDNGQHLMMGCYHATLRYVKTIGTFSKVKLQDNLSIVFRHQHKPPAELKAVTLPAPFNILFGLLRMKSVSFPNRLALLRVGMNLIFKNPDTDKHLQKISVRQWLDELRQSEENKKYLWDIIAIGALNDSTDRISAALFAKVLKTAFFGSRENSSMMIPQYGLSSVLVNGAVEFIQRNGGKVMLNTGVQSVKNTASKIHAVQLQTGEVLKPKVIISAIPYFDLPKIFMEEQRKYIPELQTLDALTSSPIVTLHLWFDAHFMKEEFVALLDSPLHWVFNKSKMYGKGEEGLMYLSIVISGADELVEKSKEELTDMARGELQRFYPTASVAKIIHSLIIKEKRATFSPKVGVEQFRPSHRISLENFFLAGDWTDTKLPATIEGAIRSGYACATLAGKHLRHSH
ncbi:MAG: hydroxysqualene dehydroxylase HpnE [Bacteroidota bacterium]|nr:hydroxysqualene dehydroxylase HpnE [Bacteroidota bacterium]